MSGNKLIHLKLNLHENKMWENEGTVGKYAVADKKIHSLISAGL